MHRCTFLREHVILSTPKTPSILTLHHESILRQPSVPPNTPLDPQFHGCTPPVLSVTMAPGPNARSLLCLYLIQTGQKPKHDGHTTVQLHAHQAMRGRLGDVLKVHGIALDEDADGDDGGEWSGGRGRLAVVIVLIGCRRRVRRAEGIRGGRGQGERGGEEICCRWRGAGEGRSGRLNLRRGIYSIRQINTHKASFRFIIFSKKLPPPSKIRKTRCEKAKRR